MVRPAPLAATQRRFWVLHGLRPSSTEYNLQFALRLHGHLNIAALQTAIDRIVERHEPLRTVVAEWPGTGLVQLVLPGRLPTIHSELLGATDDEVLAWAGVEASTHFKPGSEPPARFAVARVGREDNAIALTLHHIAFDGWSAVLFLRELEASYNALVEDKEPELPTLEVSYADYAVEEAAEVEHQRAELVAWWKAELSDLDELALVTDRPGYGAGGSAAIVRRVVDPVTADRLRELARRTSSTLFAVLLAGLEVALYRQTWQADFGIGVPVDQRTDRRLTRLIGCFVNTLCVRSDVRAGMPFRALVESVWQRLTAVIGHSLLPFEEVVREIRPSRAHNRTPLFRVFCEMVETTPEAVDLAGLKATPIVSNAERDARFDLGITFSSQGERLTASLEASTDIYNSATVEHIADQLLTILRWAAVQPELPVADLPLMSRREASRLLELTNAGGQVL